MHLLSAAHRRSAFERQLACSNLSISIRASRFLVVRLARLILPTMMQACTYEHGPLAECPHLGDRTRRGCGNDVNDRAQQGRELPVREGLTRIIVDWSGFDER